MDGRSNFRTLVWALWFTCSVNCLECPSYMSLVKDTEADGHLVCVDIYESAVVQILPNGTEIPHNYFDVVDNLIVKAIPGVNVKPQAYISAAQGGNACQLAGKRLCLLSEWLSACRGVNNYTYPYGDDYHKGYCNEGRPVNPVIQIYGEHANFNWTEMNDPRLDQLNDTVAIGGSFNHCMSEYGNFDMSGNLDEWVNHINPTGTGTFKGGYFVDAKINGPGCLYMTTAHSVTYHDYSLGFRCCVEPSQDSLQIPISIY